MFVLKTEKKAEIIVKKSRFISIAKKCESLAQVKLLVSEARTQFKDASHVVHAAIIENEFSFSDDKEPKNTAGRPAFEVLKGSGINHICVLIIRYFGGTLLGTGGLVKAYGDAVKAVLEDIETEELIEKKKAKFSIPYSLYDPVKKCLSKHNYTDLDEVFLTNISISAFFKEEDILLLEKELKEISNGQINIITSS